jgi:hypothetical protein
MPARVSPKLHARLEAVPTAVRDIAWKAQVRLDELPDDAHEAMRDLIRARATAVRVLGKARLICRDFCCAMAASIRARRAGRPPTGDGSLV